MTGVLSSDYAKAASELLADHLRSSGLSATATDAVVRTGIDAVTVEFEVGEVEPQDGRMTMVFWATVGGLRDMAGTPIRLDLLGLGQDGYEALREGVHALTDGVVPVLRRDAERTFEAAGVSALTVTSVTGDRKPMAWDLLLGPPAIGGEERLQVQEALDNLALFQGIMDSITPALEHRVGHWFKLFLALGQDGSLHGDVKVDGVQVGVAPSFSGADWRGATGFAVRQFGLVRPADRQPDQSVIDDLARAHGSPARKRRFLGRLLGG